MSDSETTDSDSGIRFKTTSTRYKSESIEKHSSSRSGRSTTSSSSRRSRDRDRDRDRDRGVRDRRRSSVDRSRSRHSRSRSRSRSRDRRKRREKDRRSWRSKSRSRSRTRNSPRQNDRRSRDESSTENKDHSRKSDSVDAKPSSSTVVEPSKIESNKILDISVSSLSSQEETIEKEDATEDFFGPALPPTMKQQTNIETASVLANTDAIGPALPPHLIKNKHKEDESQRVIGPTLPINLPSPPPKTNESSESELSPFSEEETHSAAEDDFIGPMPGASTSSRSQLELEKRALELKLRHLDSERYDSKASTVQSREDWMVELPDIRKISDMGLGARQFRTREKLEIGDRSVWTDTPSDRERKKTGGQSSKDVARDRELEEERKKAAERDKQQEEMIKRHKKKHKRDKSLLELHQKKAKKEKKKKEAERNPDEPTRRPFDRNIDLHANRFDEAQKKAIFKKAQLLDTRFSSGASKYL